jgi:hypothetical protein
VNHDQPSVDTELPAVAGALREEAGLTQRDLGERLEKLQSWVHNCEVGNRRVDVAGFATWATACGVEPQTAFARFLAAVTPASTRRRRRGDSGKLPDDESPLAARSSGWSSGQSGAT